MKELIITDKQKFLDENYPFEDQPKLTDKLECIHCNSIITVGDYKVYKIDSGFEMICCPNAPKCNGTVIDWIEIDETIRLECRLTPEQIKDIAGELETGFRVFVHKTSGELVSIPDEDQFDDIEMDVWEEQFDLLENNAADYIEIEKWPTYEAFEWMAAFAEQCSENPELQDRLKQALNRIRPFREFKFVIDNSGEYREKWFAFKDKQTQNWVRDSLNQPDESWN